MPSTRLAFNYNLFKRKSKLAMFSQYVSYQYMTSNINYPRVDTLFLGNLYIEFNCGTEPFGYDTTEANVEFFWEGEYPGLTPVRDVPVDSFKQGYYSILKWLYSQETDRFKVKREKYKQFDHDYGTSPSLKSENLVLEDPWQEEFLFTTYRLIDTESPVDYDQSVIDVVPYTLAPIHLYEVRPMESSAVYNRELIYRKSIYDINVADMAIRIYKYPPYEEM